MPAIEWLPEVGTRTLDAPVDPGTPTLRTRGGDVVAASVPPSAERDPYDVRSPAPAYPADPTDPEQTYAAPSRTRDYYQPATRDPRGALATEPDPFDVTRPPSPEPGAAPAPAGYSRSELPPAAEPSLRPQLVRAGVQARAEQQRSLPADEVLDEPTTPYRMALDLPDVGSRVEQLRGAAQPLSQIRGGYTAPVPPAPPPSAEPPAAVPGRFGVPGSDQPPAAPAGQPAPVISTGYKAFGDSLAGHLIHYAGVPGSWNSKAMRYEHGNTAVGGYTPGQVFNLLKDTPEDTIRGTDAILSTGASNAAKGKPLSPQDITDIVHQVNTLKAKGASTIALVGVGPAVDPNVNGILARIAQQYQNQGVYFTGPVKNTHDGIHATNYNELRDQIAQARPSDKVVPSTSAPTLTPPPATGGAQPALQQPAAGPPKQNQKFDPPHEPLAFLQERLPEVADMVKYTANNFGVDPNRLAAHGALTGFKPDNPSGNIMGITAEMDKQLKQKYPDAAGQADRNTMKGSIWLAGLAVRDADLAYGANTAASIAHYRGDYGTDPHAYVGQVLQRPQGEKFDFGTADPGQIPSGSTAPPGTQPPPGAGGGGPTQQPQGQFFGATGTGAGHVAPKSERLAYMEQAAKREGVNPYAMMMTAGLEGLHSYVGDINDPAGKSYGDFQLNEGGMGKAARAAGIDISDPNTWKQQIDFVAKQMAAHKGDANWFAGQWHGPRDNGPWAVQNFGNPDAPPPAGFSLAGGRGSGGISGRSPPWGTVHPAHSPTGAGGLNVNDIVWAGNQAIQSGNPAVFANYLQSNAPGLGMSEAWSHARSLLIEGHIMRGDIKGAQDSVDFVNQMMYTGWNQNLMMAYRALQSGDTTGAANFLSRAHNQFAPDGSISRYGVTKDGQLVGLRFDEHTGQPMGNPILITPQGISGMLQSTLNPEKFQDRVQAEQKAASEAHLKNAQAGYYGNLNASRLAGKAIDAGSRERIAAGVQAGQTGRVDTQVAAANARANQAAERATIVARINERSHILAAREAAGNKPDTQLETQMHTDIKDLIDKSGDDLEMPADVAADPKKAGPYKGAVARVMKGIMQTSRVPGDTAFDSAKGVMSGRYSLVLRQGPSGETGYAVLDAATGKPVGTYLPKAEGDLLKTTAPTVAAPSTLTIGGPPAAGSALSTTPPSLAGTGGTVATTLPAAPPPAPAPQPAVRR